MQVLASEEVPDKLIFNNDTLALFAYPLEGFLKFDSLRERLFENKENYWISGCSRGYQAEWTIIDKQLYLTAIYSCSNEDSIKSDLKLLFGEKFIDGKVKADWVTGNILSGYGNPIFCFYESFYKKEIDFEFIEGQLKGLTTYDNSKSRKSNYSNDSDLEQFIYSNIKWDILPNEDKIVRVIVQFSGNEEGLIDSVTIKRGFDITFDNEALRVIKSIPEWDVYFRRGKHERRDWVIPIVFNKENRQEYQQKRKLH